MKSNPHFNEVRHWPGLRPFRIFSPSNLSIKHRLPLIMCTLQLGLLVASTWASYQDIKSSALEVGRERLLTGVRRNYDEPLKQFIAI